MSIEARHGETSPPQNRFEHRFGRTVLRAALMTSACVALMGVATAARADDTAGTTKHRKASGVATAATPTQVVATQAQIDALNKQIQALQSQLQALATQQDTNAKAVVDSRAAAEKAAAAATQVAQQQKVTDPNDNSLRLGKGVKLTFGGFIEAASVYRSRNMTADVATPYAAIPLKNSSNYDRGEFRGTARQSRVTMLAESDVGPDTHLGAYFESDFLGVGTSSNSGQSNSYVPRLRQGYLTADWKDTGWHLLAGQSFSLVTTNKSGIDPRTEALPMGPDAQYAAGFDWTRNWGLRVVKDWNRHYWLGVALESPQASISGSTALVPNSNTNPGGSLLNSTANYSTDIAPDLIVKAVAEPGWGHYEVFGLAREFQSRAAGQNYTETGFGFGAAAILPVVPKYVDIQLSTMAGQGIGRYGSSSLPDVTVNPYGRLSPITEVTAMAGVIGHPTSDWDLYAYYGLEQDDSKAFTVAGKAYGYGNGLAVNTGCYTENSPLACAGNTRSVREATAGFWWKFYHGNMGTMQFGMQGEYIRRDLFQGVGGSPSTDDTVVYTAFRYYPF
ncbi:hypothetical protein [Nitrospirillum pindoramense]|uniref:Porin n=1 Tax=Nitrospirillum amazonense TaxID=28077 RepID=A0A560GSN7_9PROT|nr:hypothetical protein [Nitrospirillum amazonense]TWB36524.1 hypothetical protein FBZ90_11785 [Nitrospirillum amazonense]